MAPALLSCAMNVSWNDLNNVGGAGEYTGFATRTITVTFAEIAIWKNNQDAKFELMREHEERAPQMRISDKSRNSQFRPLVRPFTKGVTALVVSGPGIRSQVLDP